MSTRTVLDSDLQNIRDDILRMGSLVNQAMQRAMEAFGKHATSMAQQVISEDDDLDNLHINLEEQIIKTVALQQPNTTDLRTLIAALLIANELERMGDHAEGIARIVLLNAESPAIDTPNKLYDMKAHVSKMIERVMEVYAENNPKEAKEVARMDDIMDAMYQDFFDQVVGQMAQGELTVKQGTYLLWAGHGMERIGDRVTNICERIVYARTGEIDGLNPKPDED